ncbi:MAG: NIPSNAP family protein [Actinobacteria bacterium]|nr:MAG: NIPSNAP family protein [Actinomycetota bacterium]
MTTTEQTSTNLIELRQYLLHAGQRDTLIDVFDREFVETQEAVGMDVLGQFRDPQRPDYFVWLRGFPDMAARHESLTTFYDGPVWAKHRDVANATMIDSDNVMLLRAVTKDDALPAHRPNQRDMRNPTGLVVVVAEHVEHIKEESILNFKSDVIPVLHQSGCRTLGVYATEVAPNTFARLRVRTDRAIVWIGAIDSDDSSAVRQAITPLAERRRDRHVLIPTTRSVLDGTAR